MLIYSTLQNTLITKQFFFFFWGAPLYTQLVVVKSLIMFWAKIYGSLKISNLHASV